MFRWNALSFLGHIQKTITEVSKNLFVDLYITFAPFPIANVVIISYQRLKIKNYLHILLLDFLFNRLKLIFKHVGSLYSDSQNFP